VDEKTYGTDSRRRFAEAEEKLEILKMSIEKLTSAGYEFIGMDHFANPMMNYQLQCERKNFTEISRDTAKRRCRSLRIWNYFNQSTEKYLRTELQTEKNTTLLSITKLSNSKRL